MEAAFDVLIVSGHHNALRAYSTAVATVFRDPVYAQTLADEADEAEIAGHSISTRVGLWTTRAKSLLCAEPFPGRPDPFVGPKPLLSSKLRSLAIACVVALLISGAALLGLLLFVSSDLQLQLSLTELAGGTHYFAATVLASEAYLRYEAADHAFYRLSVAASFLYPALVTLRFPTSSPTDARSILDLYAAATDAFVLGTAPDDLSLPSTRFSALRESTTLDPSADSLLAADATYSLGTGDLDIFELVASLALDARLYARCALLADATSLCTADRQASRLAAVADGLPTTLGPLAATSPPLMAAAASGLSFWRLILWSVVAAAGVVAVALTLMFFHVASGFSVHDIPATQLLLRLPPVAFQHRRKVSHTSGRQATATGIKSTRKAKTDATEAVGLASLSFLLRGALAAAAALFIFFAALIGCLLLASDQLQTQLALGTATSTALQRLAYIEQAAAFGLRFALDFNAADRADFAAAIEAASAAHSALLIQLGEVDSPQAALLQRNQGACLRANTAQCAQLAAATSGSLLGAGYASDLYFGLSALIRNALNAAEVLASSASLDADATAALNYVMNTLLIDVPAGNLSTALLLRETNLEVSQSTLIPFCILIAVCLLCLYAFGVSTLVPLCRRVAHGHRRLELVLLAMHRELGTCREAQELAFGPPHIDLVKETSHPPTRRID
jgi:hypothetical protein